MPILYRSPIIPIDKHEWRIEVERTRSGRVITKHSWRAPGQMWQSIAKWPGRKPKGMWRFFEPFKHSVRIARGEVTAGTQRRAAA